jgi:2-dehydro-3-deoxyphosphogluconate aldolase/(4S)-4-hydroxy-2-oxoglutarate aldolase
MRLAPVIPVVIIDDARMPCRWRVLWSPAASRDRSDVAHARRARCDRAIAAEVEGAVVGVGTVLTAKDLHAARTGRRALCRIARRVAESARCRRRQRLPLLPGAATASEAMNLLERGYRHLKFFPAVPAGGTKLLGAWASPLPQFASAPRAASALTSAPDFLALPNVLCVGGSWLTPKDKFLSGDWEGIEQLAREAALLRGVVVSA